MVTEKDPVGVAAVVATVSVEVAAPFAGGVSEVGLTEQLVFAGHPERLNETAPLNPFKEFTVTVEFAVCPCVSVKDAGFVEIEKSGTGGVPQEVNLNEPKAVLQLKLPFVWRY